MGGSKLPIEDDRELLAEYGRVFAWINVIEYSLEHLFIFKSKLNSIDSKTREKLLKGKTLGQKIELSKHLLPEALVKELVQLNEHRVTLAHSVVGQEVIIGPSGQKMGDLVVGGKKGKRILNTTLTNEIIELAQKISNEFYNQYLPKQHQPKPPLD